MDESTAGSLAVMLQHMELNELAQFALPGYTPLATQRNIRPEMIRVPQNLEASTASLLSPDVHFYSMYCSFVQTYMYVIPPANQLKWWSRYLVPADAGVDAQARCTYEIEVLRARSRRDIFGDGGLLCRTLTRGTGDAPAAWDDVRLGWRLWRASDRATPVTSRDGVPNTRNPLLLESRRTRVRQMWCRSSVVDTELCENNV